MLYIINSLVPGIDLETAIKIVCGTDAAVELTEMY
jgi:hypothetical protein